MINILLTSIISSEVFWFRHIETLSCDFFLSNLTLAQSVIDLLLAVPVELV